MPSPNRTRIALALAHTAARSSRLPVYADDWEAWQALDRPAPARRDWLAGRLAARRAAASLAGVPLGAVRLRDHRGAPPEALVPSPRRVLVSLTHAAGRAAAVATFGPMAVGVDLERAGAVSPAHARYFLSPRERREVETDLTEQWTLKEAAWKALRCPPSTPLQAVELRRSSSGAVLAVALDGSTRRARASITRPWPGFILAIVAVGAPA